MNDDIKKIISDELMTLLEQKKSRPYVFRTRLERTLTRISNISEINSYEQIKKACNKLKENLNYISDKSNQTSDGILNSYLFLEKDIKEILLLL